MHAPLTQCPTAGPCPPSPCPFPPPPAPLPLPRHCREQVLLELHEHPIARLIFEHRKLRTLLNRQGGPGLLPCAAHLAFSHIVFETCSTGHRLNAEQAAEWRADQAAVAPKLSAPLLLPPPPSTPQVCAGLQDAPGLCRGCELPRRAGAEAHPRLHQPDLYRHRRGGLLRCRDPSPAARRAAAPAPLLLRLGIAVTAAAASAGPMAAQQGTRRMLLGTAGATPCCPPVHTHAPSARSHTHAHAAPSSRRPSGHG